MGHGSYQLRLPSKRKHLNSQVGGGFPVNTPDFIHTNTSANHQLQPHPPLRPLDSCPSCQLFALSSEAQVRLRKGRRGIQPEDTDTGQCKAHLGP